MSLPVQPNHHGWSHRAVYLAGREAGWHELRTASTDSSGLQGIVKCNFANAYQWLTNQV